MLNAALAPGFIDRHDDAIAIQYRDLFRQGIQHGAVKPGARSLASRGVDS
jgi:hypothetical protein